MTFLFSSDAETVPFHTHLQRWVNKVLPDWFDIPFY